MRLLLVLAVAVPFAAAAEHPVPLDPKADSSKCLECHEDKGKGAHVHTAISMGCTSCHEIRVNRDVTRVKLNTAVPSKLCISCHSDKNAATLKGRIHQPAVRDCLKCHDPHESANKDQLLKPLSGGKSENLCLSCHDIGVKVASGGSRHPALDMGCDTCHNVHKVGDATKREFKYHLAKDTPALCLDCHDAKDESLAKAHNHQPFANADCLGCHDPHQSTRPHLMQAFLHVPFDGGADACSTCHQPAKDGKVVLTAASPKELCVTCHAEKAEQIDKAKVQHPGAAGDCTDCHSPHAGASPGFLKPDPVSVCLNCHSEQAELAKKAHLHQPAFEQGCAVCHDPHRDDNQHLLRVSDTNQLCLECHGPDANPQKRESAHLVTIFNGKVELPENYFQKVPVLPLKYGLGHPIDNHPVGDTLNPKTNKTVSMSCLTCHQPHSGTSQGMLVKDQKDNMAFCKSCHVNPLDLMDVRIGGN